MMKFFVYFLIVLSSFAAGAQQANNARGSAQPVVQEKKKPAAKPVKKVKAEVEVVAPPVIRGIPSRIKDIADFQGVRSNLLVGYGLVVGLNGTGDKLTSSTFTKESLISMLERLGINARDKSLSSKNVAGVIVTATLPPFARAGTTIDVNISTLGDATSLRGGTLVATPLKAADNEVYALAQGTLIVSGFGAKGAGASITKGVPTTARLSSGAIIERELPFKLQEQDQLKILLKNPDFTTAERVVNVINRALGKGIAHSLDPSTIKVKLLGRYKHNIVDLITRIEKMSVVPDNRATVIIDETAGVTVMTADVRISPVAIAQGNITVTVNEAPIASQPAPFSDGETTVLPRTSIEVQETGGSVAIVQSGPTLRSLVNMLNRLGVKQTDLAPLLTAVKAAGALQAEIKVSG